MANPGPPLESPLPPVGTVLLVNNWISLCYKVYVFVGQLRCEIHRILQAWATNTVLYDAIPVILLLHSERIQHRYATVV